MSSRSMNLDVLVRLRDRLSGPLRRLRDQLKAIGDFARKIGAVGAAIAAISFMGPIQEAAAFQQKLLDIAGTAGLSGKAAFDFTEEARVKIGELAIATGQASDDIASAIGQMTAAGIDQMTIDASINDISRAATAANASISDMAEVSTSLMQSLDIKPEGLKDALGALVTAGKEGAFELKDMARYFPTLTSQVTKFGVKGREAVNFLGAALQIARKGTSDPAEAANNLKNFLSKILAPATIKNFKDAGVDIEAVMQDAAVKGINPIEAVVQKISMLTQKSGVDIVGMLQKAKANGLEGADALKSVQEQLTKIQGAGALGELFADQQVMDVLLPWLANIEEYKRIKAEVEKATGAIVDQDFETQMEGLNRQLTVFRDIGSQAAIEVGLAFGSWLPTINGYFAEGIRLYRVWNKESGGMGTQLLTLAGGGVLAATALGALGLVLPIIGAGFAALGALLSPIGVLIAAAAAGGVYLWKNWGSYGPRLKRLWDGMKQGFKGLSDGFKGWLKDPGAAFGRFRIAIRSVMTAVGELFAALAEGFTGGAETRKALADYLRLFADGAWDAGAKLLNKAGQGVRVLANAIRDFREAYAEGGFVAGLKAMIDNLSPTAKVVAIGLLAANMIKLAGALRGLAALNMTSMMAGFAGIPVVRLLLAAGALGLLADKLGILQKFNDWTGLSLDWVDAFLAIFGGLKIAQALAGPFTAATAASAAAGTAAGTAFGSAYKVAVVAAVAAATMAALQAVDPKGNLGGLTTPLDDALRSLLGLQKSDRGITPGELYSGSINRLKQGLQAIGAISTPDQALQTKTTNVISLENAKRAREAGSSLIPGSTDNQPGKLKDDLGIGAPRVIPAPPQKVDVGGQVTIKVEGPGKVTSVSSTNPQAPLRTSNTGRVVGGV